VTDIVTPSSRVRLITVVVLGSLAGGLVAALGPWQLAVLAGWDVSAATFIMWVWLSVGRFTPAETGAFATREDDSRVATSILLLSASVASLVGVGLDLFKASNAHNSGRVTLTAIAVLTVALSWGVVHTVFALRYAHEYYTEPIGGIDFKTQIEEPDYLDFAYVAFTIGMTFQISDTDVQVGRIRRTVVRHALLSYLFGAVILAVMVNVIASVVQ
jgi:uncharacterized membrane protein